ncbi:MAG: uncharacterized membrane-anchored protein YhcB (DUF1043 family) [Gammaproteobacteria bacterium]
MDNLDSVWQISIISLFAGVLIGALAYRLLSPSVKHINEVESDLSKAREEMASYKANVNQHFNKTSELVNDLTQDYVKVYQHLADGAQSLGDIGTLNNLLENRQGKLSIAISDEVKTRDVGPVVAPIEVAAIRAINEESEPAGVVEINKTGPKDYDDGTAISQLSESVGEENETNKSHDPVPDASAAESEIESVDTDTQAKQGSEGAAIKDEQDPASPDTAVDKKA